MKPISSQDYFQSRRCYGEVSLDIASLTDFYLPLVGSNAFSTYLALSREGEKTFTHKDLVDLLGLTLGELEIAIGRLEAVGLIRTFFQAEGKTRLFVYCLYAPLHASEFNADIMLSGTLKGKLGEETYANLLSRHSGKEGLADMEEISTSFPEVFKPTYDAKYYLSSANPDSISGKANPKTGFDSVLFDKKLVALGIRKNALSEQELTDIGKIMNLHNVDMDVMAELVSECILPNVPFGKKLDREALYNKAANASSFKYLQQAEEGRSSEVDGDTALAKRVKDMDEMTPIRFLSSLQGNHKPPLSEIRLINRLSIDIGLPNPCINALLDYVLQTHDNQLPAVYCEKVAASLVRARCKSAQDAMDYLIRIHKKNRKPVRTNSQPLEVVAPIEQATESQDTGETVTDEELDALFNGEDGDK